MKLESYCFYELTYEEIKFLDTDFDKVLAKFRIGKEEFERIGISDFATLQSSLYYEQSGCSDKEE